MTIEELYKWAKENNVIDCDLIIRDYDGSKTSSIEPEIINENGYVRVEL